MKTEHYIGKIVEDDDDDDDDDDDADDVNKPSVVIKYLKRENKNAYKFTFYSDRLYPFLDDDIVCKLPAPIPHGGTARVSQHFIFPVDLSGFQNLL